jgi:cytochrome bd-type quinol oxidase subunit 2
MLIANLVAILIISVGLVYSIFKSKEYLKTSNIHTHIIVMSVSMLLPLLFGLLLGVILDENYILVTMIATAYGVLIGCIIGILFNPFVMLSGMVEGLMGGLMGAMTGMMVAMSPDVMTLILFFNALFLVLIFGSFNLLYRYMNNISPKNQSKPLLSVNQTSIETNLLKDNF